MSTYHARIVQGTVVEVISFDPTGRYPADFLWRACPPDTRQGATYDGENFINPAPPPAASEPDPAPPNTRLDTPLFLLRFTPAERIALKAAAKANTEYAPLIEDWLTILNDPRLAYVELGDPNLIAAMTMMVQLGLITQERADQIMAPV